MPVVRSSTYAALRRVNDEPWRSRMVDPIAVCGEGLNQAGPCYKLGYKLDYKLDYNGL